MQRWKVVLAGTILAQQAVCAHAESLELEVCEFIGTMPDSKGRTVPPGLDEPLNCDHKCFYDELGINPLGSVKPNLDDMYSIGWRLRHMKETTYDGKVVWTLFLERKDDGVPNKCDSNYAPKKPSSNSATISGDN